MLQQAQALTPDIDQARETTDGLVQRRYHAVDEVMRRLCSLGVFSFSSEQFEGSSS